MPLSPSGLATAYVVADLLFVVGCGLLLWALISIRRKLK